VCVCVCVRERLVINIMPQVLSIKLNLLNQEYSFKVNITSNCHVDLNKI